jgi:hypothetical protein
MNSKEREHKKGVADDISDHCVDQATLKIMTAAMQISVKEGCFGEVRKQCCIHRLLLMIMNCSH